MTRQTITHDGIERSAKISDCGMYRYWLRRTWDKRLPGITWIMLNPSTADALVDDNTIRRCNVFARKWGCGWIEVRNLFAYRTSSPDELKAAAAAGVDVVGPDGDAALAVLSEALLETDRGRVVVAWGNHGAFKINGRSRADRVLDHWFTKTPLWCLDTSKHGHPVHPLYQPGTLQLIPFNAVAKRLRESQNEN